MEDDKEELKITKKNFFFFKWKTTKRNWKLQKKTSFFLNGKKKKRNKERKRIRKNRPFLTSTRSLGPCATNPFTFGDQTSNSHWFLWHPYRHVETFRVFLAEQQQKHMPSVYHDQKAGPIKCKLSTVVPLLTLSLCSQKT